MYNHQRHTFVLDLHRARVSQQTQQVRFTNMKFHKFTRISFFTMRSDEPPSQAYSPAHVQLIPQTQVNRLITPDTLNKPTNQLCPWVDCAALADEFPTLQFRHRNVFKEVFLPVTFIPQSFSFIIGNSFLKSNITDPLLTDSRVIPNSFVGFLLHNCRLIGLTLPTGRFHGFIMNITICGICSISSSTLRSTDGRDVLIFEREWSNRWLKLPHSIQNLSFFSDYNNITSHLSRLWNDLWLSCLGHLTPKKMNQQKSISIFKTKEHSWATHMDFDTSHHGIP